MCKEIFTKILTVVILASRFRSIYFVFLCLSEFSNFHIVSNYYLNNACSKSLHTVLVNTPAQKMVGIIIVSVKQ